MNDRLAIGEFVQGLLDKKSDRPAFSDSEKLVARRRPESIDTLEVWVFLEEKNGVDFGEMGFDQNQVGSINDIVALIGGK
jgi:hypothetical protein